jgi:hypothetical protein
MISDLGPVAVALVSWIVFNAIGRPLLRFFDLRTEVRRTTILYDNVRARWTERDNVRLSPSDDKDTTPNSFERQGATHRKLRIARASPGGKVIAALRASREPLQPLLKR